MLRSIGQNVQSKKKESKEITDTRLHGRTGGVEILIESGVEWRGEEQWRAVGLLFCLFLVCTVVVIITRPPTLMLMRKARHKIVAIVCDVFLCLLL